MALVISIIFVIGLNLLAISATTYDLVGAILVLISMGIAILLHHNA